MHQPFDVSQELGLCLQSFKTFQLGFYGLKSNYILRKSIKKPFIMKIALCD